MLVAAITVALVASLAPPARYDYEPRVPYHVTYLPQERIQRICASEVHSGGDMALGCSLPDLGFIFVASELQPKVKALILRHEKAHMNGWVHSHGSAVEAASLGR